MIESLVRLMEDLLRAGRSTFWGGEGGGGIASTSLPSFLKIGSTCLLMEPRPKGEIFTEPEVLRRWPPWVTELLIIISSLPERIATNEVCFPSYRTPTSVGLKSKIKTEIQNALTGISRNSAEGG